jgi:hypothetical protein
MIPLTMFRSKLALLVACATGVVLLTIAACGGGGDDAPSASLAAGAIGCEQMFEDSYQYSVQIDLDVGPLPAVAPTPTGQGRPPFHFTTIVKGQVQDGVKLQGKIDNTDGNSKTVYDAIQIGDTGYLKFDETGWRANDTSLRPIPFPYSPMTVCESIAPDVDTTALGTPANEETSGVSTERYELTNLGIDFFKRSPEFGGASDAAAYLSSLSGTLWVAEKGRYPAKFDITAQGSYPSGQVLTVRVQFEVWGLGSDIQIEEPPLGTPGG